MISFERQWIAYAVTVVDVAAAVVIGFHVLWALTALVRSQGTDRARLIVADGVLAGLGFSVAGTLLKTIALQSWEQMGTFVFVYALRTMLKKVFAWERVTIAARTLPDVSRGNASRANAD